jgi:hypothetical protein
MPQRNNQTRAGSPTNTVEQIMRILPYDKLHFVVKMSPSEVCNRLLENTSTFWTSILPSSEDPLQSQGANTTKTAIFKGNVQDETFKIQRNSYFMRSFLIMYGSIKAAPAGTEICLKMKLHPFAQIFLFVWMAMAIFKNLIVEKDYQMGLSFIVIGVLFTYLVFWYQAKISRSELISLFEKDIATANNGVVSDTANDSAPHTP